MSQIAKLFTNGRSQAVRLPAAFRFNTQEVFIHKDVKTGDIVLSRKPASWDEFLAVLASVNTNTEIPADFLNAKEREQSAPDADPFAGWRE